MGGGPTPPAQGHASPAGMPALGVEPGCGCGRALASPMSEQPESPKVQFDPAAPHHAKPKLRQIKGFPAQVQGRQVMGIADARQISRKVVFTAPGAQQVLPLMDGTRTVEEIASQVGQGLEVASLQALVAQLDDAALLHGPRFEELWTDFTRAFDSSELLPPSNSADFADALVRKKHGEDASEEQLAAEAAPCLREHFDEMIDRALEGENDPSLDALPLGIVVPAMDYQRAGAVFAKSYGRLRVVDRPDRIVILGPNHYGRSSGVCGCDKGFQSPLGSCQADSELVERLRGDLGEPLFEHRYDHEREHCVELQIPWIQHVFGADESGAYPRVFAALVHDAAANNGESYDGKGVAIQPFVEALRSALADLGGRTLVVCSFDLSHVGPMFGDQVPLLGESEQTQQFRNQVVQHDRDMLGLLSAGKPEEMVASMAWQQNPTRWSSTGPIVAAMGVTAPSRLRVQHYQGAIDPNGQVFVSAIAGVLQPLDVEAASASAAGEASAPPA